MYIYIYINIYIYIYVCVCVCVCVRVITRSSGYNCSVEYDRKGDLVC